MSHTEEPLVSVIITNYNYARYIGEAIESVLAQTYKKIEILIIDDGSQDDSDKVISEYSQKYSNITYIRQKNMGVVSSRNKGIEKAKGDYIVFLDGDDKFPPDYVQETLAVAMNEHIDVVYTDFERFGEDDTKSNFYEYDEKKLRSKNYIHASSLIKRNAIGDTRFDKNLSGLSHEDWDFILALSYKGLTFKKTNATWLLYRAHNQSRSTTTSEYALRAVKSYFYILDKYRNKYPGTIEINEDSEVVEAWRLADERRVLILDQKELIDNQEKRIIEQQKYIKTLEEKVIALTDIVNSRRYKIASTVADTAHKVYNLPKKIVKKHK